MMNLMDPMPKRVREKYYRTILFIVVALALSALAFAEDEVAQPAPKEKPPQSIPTKVNADRYENLGLFQKVLYFVEQNYVDEVTNKQLVYGAIKGMLETLDPHSNFLEPDTYREMKSDTSGHFGGVGIEIGLKDSILTVISPIEDTPAFKVGLKSGDKLLKINGESTKGMTLVDAVTKMRGKKGTNVSIVIWRAGFDKPKEFQITRAEIKIQSAKTEALEPNYQYVRLTNFNENTAQDLKKAIAESEKANGKLKGLVLDLRNNPGGLLDQAVDVASLFLDEGVIVSTKGRTEERVTKYAKKGWARKDFLMTVLVNGASASASEIVAGALQDYKRAIILGQPTFGKGSVQTVVELTPEVGLKLTIARYYTPLGRSIQLKGIQPDIVLEDIDQKALDEITKKALAIRERDLKHAVGAEGADNDFKPEEYALQIDDTAGAVRNGSKNKKNSDTIADERNEKSEVADKKREDTVKPFVAKEDYQVRQALAYMKSTALFQSQPH